MKLHMTRLTSTHFRNPSCTLLNSEQLHSGESKSNSRSNSPYAAAEDYHIRRTWLRFDSDSHEGSALNPPVLGSGRERAQTQLTILRIQHAGLLRNWSKTLFRNRFAWFCWLRVVLDTQVIWNQFVKLPYVCFLRPVLSNLLRLRKRKKTWTSYI